MSAPKVDGKPVYDKIDTSKGMINTASSAGTASRIYIDDQGLIQHEKLERESSKIVKDKSALNQDFDKKLTNDWREQELEKVRLEMLKVENYNKTLYETRDPNLDSMLLLGNKVLIRLFKLQRYNKHGFHVGGRMIEKMSKSELNKTLVEAPEETQFQEKGVVIKVGEGCSEQFKSIVKPGYIVDIDPTAFNPRNQRWIQKTTIHETYDNYFSVSEYNIEFVESK